MLKWICIGILILFSVCGIVLIAMLLHLLWKVIRKGVSMSDEITGTKKQKQK